MKVLTEWRLNDGSTVILRRAVVDDVPSIVGLLADDPLGSTRDGVGSDHSLQP